MMATERLAGGVWRPAGFLLRVMGLIFKRGLRIWSVMEGGSALSGVDPPVYGRSAVQSASDRRISILSTAIKTARWVGYCVFRHFVQGLSVRWWTAPQVAASCSRYGPM